MILFIFEGKVREPHIFYTMQHLYFPEQKEESIVCTYNTNIYGLYQEIEKLNPSFDQEVEVDVVAILKERGNEDLKNYKRRSDFAEIFLVFDYECQHSNMGKSTCLKTLNKELENLLRVFNCETDMGKLYINYPMVESIRYTKKLPDLDYHTYSVPIDSCGSFCKNSEEFSFSGNLDFIAFKLNKHGKQINAPKTEEERNKVFENWEHIKVQNVKKANYICNDKNEIPISKEMISQENVFKNQIVKYVGENFVSVLSAFPLFLFDYLKVDHKN